MKQYSYRDRAWLYKEYILEGKSQKQIANEVGCDPVTIRNWLQRYSIPIRSRTDTYTTAIRKQISDSVKTFYGGEQTWRNYDWLYQKYVVEKLTQKQIASLAGCANTTILYWMRNLGIPVRSPSQARQAMWDAVDRPWKHYDWLYQKYIVECLSLRQIADIAEGGGAIQDWLVKFGIPVRTQAEGIRLSWTEERRKERSINQATKTGKDSPNWRGGLSYELYPLEFNEIFKQMIRERDRNVCAICRLPERNGKKLSIHHIDYAKENTTPKNCISLCNACHSVTHGDRNYWRSALSGLLQKRIIYLEECNASI